MDKLENGTEVERRSNHEGVDGVRPEQDFAYLRETGLPETKFGRLAVHDPRLIGDMRRGRRIGHRMKSRVERFMAEHRP